MYVRRHRLRDMNKVRRMNGAGTVRDAGRMHAADSGQPLCFTEEMPSLRIVPLASLKASQSLVMSVLRILGCSMVHETSKGKRQLTVYIADVSGEFSFVMWDTEDKLQTVKDRLLSDTVAVCTELMPNLWNGILSFKLRASSKIYITGEEDDIEAAAMPPAMKLNEFIFTEMGSIGANDKVEMHVCVKEIGEHGATLTNGVAVRDVIMIDADKNVANVCASVSVVCRD